MKRIWYWMFAGWIAEERKRARERTIEEFRACMWGNGHLEGIGFDVKALWEVAKDLHSYDTSASRLTFVRKSFRDRIDREDS